MIIKIIPSMLSRYNSFLMYFVYKMKKVVENVVFCGIIVIMYFKMGGLCNEADESSYGWRR